MGSDPRRQTGDHMPRKPGPGGKAKRPAAGRFKPQKDVVCRLLNNLRLIGKIKFQVPLLFPYVPAQPETCPSEQAGASPEYQTGQAL